MEPSKNSPKPTSRRAGSPVSLDSQGFRHNVGMVLCNRQGEVMLFKRYQQASWQFPQGGIDEGETPLEAMHRELHEEVGLQATQVQVLGETQGWYPYVLPRRLLSQAYGAFVGQKQKWFLLELLADPSEIRFDVQGAREAEFEAFQWVSYWYPLREIVNFKREAYAGMLLELLPALQMALQISTSLEQSPKS